MKPSARTVALFTVLAAAAFVLLPWIGTAASAAVFALCAGLVLLDAVWLWRTPAPVVVIDAPPIVSLRRPFEIGVGGVAGLRAVLVAAAALGGAVRVHDGKALLTPVLRGRWPLRSVWSFQSSPFGLWLRRTVTAVEVALEVWPDLRDDDARVGASDPRAGSRAQRGMFVSSLELRGLRPFVSGDDPRHVDWKASARHTEPVVREWEPERRRTVIFALDAGRLMRARHENETKLDACLRAVGRVALAAGSEGDRVGALVFDSRTLRFVPPMSGKMHAFELLRALNDVQPSLTASDFRAAVPHLLGHRRRALVVVMTDLGDREDAIALARGVTELRPVHLPRVVMVKTPGLESAVETPGAGTAHAYRRAAAELLLADRRALIGELRARGVDALDLPMGRLGDEATGLYLEARAQAVW